MPLFLLPYRVDGYTVVMGKTLGEHVKNVISWFGRNWFKVAILVAIGATALVVNRKVNELIAMRSTPPSTLQLSSAVLNNGVEDPGFPIQAFSASDHPEIVRTVPRLFVYKQPEFPSVREDILDKLGVVIDNEFQGTPYGITDNDIRAAADTSYRLLRIADPGLKGIRLTVRDSEQPGGVTEWHVDRGQVIVSVNGLQWAENSAHEMTHVLMGRVGAESILPGFIAEFVAEAAETNPNWFPPGSPLYSMTYDRLNVPILAVAKSVFGSDSRIAAPGSSGGVPLDAVRYDLLRLAAVKIGNVAHRDLAMKIYAFAEQRKAPVTAEELLPLFTNAGLGDCALFSKARETGMSVDVAFRNDGTPLVMWKQVSTDGVESSFPAALRFMWRRDGKPISNSEMSTNPMGFLVDDGGKMFAAFADEYDVTLGTNTYTYKIVEDASTYGTVK